MQQGREPRHLGEATGKPHHAGQGLPVSFFARRAPGRDRNTSARIPRTVLMQGRRRVCAIGIHRPARRQFRSRESGRDAMAPIAAQGTAEYAARLPRCHGPAAASFPRADDAQGRRNYLEPDWLDLAPAEIRLRSVSADCNTSATNSGASLGNGLLYFHMLAGRTGRSGANVRQMRCDGPLSYVGASRYFFQQAGHGRVQVGMENRRARPAEVALSN